MHVVEGETLLGVVELDEILVDGAGFPEGEARVGVLDGGYAAVGVDVGEGLLLDVVEAERFDFVVEFELFEEEDDLVNAVVRDTFLIIYLTNERPSTMSEFLTIPSKGWDRGLCLVLAEVLGKGSLTYE